MVNLQKKARTMVKLQKSQNHGEIAKNKTEPWWKQSNGEIAKNIEPWCNCKKKKQNRGEI